MLEEIERDNLRWYGHVMRMDEERKPKKYLKWTPRGKRPAGRPRRRWIEGVEKAMDRRGKSRREIEESGMYLNREEWRSFLKIAPTDR